MHVKFIKSAHLKYGIYKPREVEHLKKKLASALVSLSDVQPPSVYKSHILIGPINKLYLLQFLSKTEIENLTFSVKDRISLMNTKSGIFTRGFAACENTACVVHSVK